MRKYLVSTLILIMVLTIVPATHSVRAEEMSLSQLINLLIALQVIAPEKQETARYYAASLEQQHKPLEAKCMEILPNQTLSQGMSGSEVTRLQTFFAHNPEWYPEGQITGYFGVLTAAATKRFQKAHGLDETGIVAEPEKERLRCTQQDLTTPPTFSEYMTTIEEDKALNDRLYGLHIEEARWKERLIKSDREIPSGQFRAFYLDDSDLSDPIYEEVVDRMGISYFNYDDENVFEIDPETLAAYWIGELSFSEEVEKEINISQSWSEVRLIIDDEIVYHGKDEQIIPFTFSRGSHVVEVEFLNDWHTTDVSVTIDDPLNELNGDQVRSELDQLLVDQSEVEVWYVGVYGVDSLHRDVEVKLSETSKPIVLLLSSHSNVYWNIDSNDQDLAAVIYSSYEPGTQLLGLSSEIPTYYLGDGEVSYRSERLTYKGVPSERCVVENYNSRCRSQYRDFLEMVRRVEALSGHKVTGFGGSYEVDRITLPETDVTDEFVAEIEAR